MHPDLLRLKELRPVLEQRQAVVRAIRSFFEARNFLEVETPVRVPTPALEQHIEAEPSGEHYLRTSPELAMKRLLAAGYGRLFQIGPCFRQGEQGRHHHPEFSLLEWYRSGATYLDILADTKALIAHVALETRGTTDLVYQGQAIELMPLWDCLKVSEAFRIHAGWDPVAEFDADRFDLDLTEKVEPRLAAHRPTVLMDYPAPLAALARLHPEPPARAERWELYIGGLELANAYTELVDPEEQRRRFDVWAQERRAAGRPVYGVDETFMAALESGLPPCAGIALGVDRLLMLLTDQHSLDDVLPFRHG